MSAPLTLLECASRLGRCRYVELECFALLGSAAALVGAPAARSLSGASAAHAERARLLESHLPVSVGLPGVGESTVAAHRGLGAELGRRLSPSLGGEALLGELADRIYPAMRHGYGEHLARCSPFADGALARTLRRLTDDLDGVAAELRAELVRVGATEPATPGDPGPLSADLFGRLPPQHDANGTA